MLESNLIVNPQMLSIARESRGLIYDEVSSLTGISKAQVWRLEQGAQNCGQEELIKIANALNFPESFFYQSSELVTSGLMYRKKDNVPQKILTVIEANTNIYRMNMETLLPLMNFNASKLPLIDVAKYGSPQACAQQLRKIWKMGKAPIDNLSECMELNGILLISSDFATDRADARLTIALDKYPIIITNKNLLGDRQRFTLAYQLGHLAMHVKTLVSSDRDISHEANLFAAELLMPEATIREDLENLTLAKLAELKRKWKVSMQALLYRASDLDIVSYNQKRYILTQFNQQNMRRREPKELDVPVEKYHQVTDLLTFYRSRHKLSLTKFSHFLNLNSDDFMNRYQF